MYVDSHSHLDVDAFDTDRAGVLARAAAAGVTRHVVPAIDAAGWPRLREVCAAHDGLFPAYGLHPVYLDAHDDRDVDALRGWLARERPVAVGECGLDFFVDGLDRERQLQLFEAQLRLARESDLPVIVHARRAVDAVIAAIRRVGGLRGVVHSFAGSLQQAEVLAKLGFLIGLGGPVTYERANRLRRLAADVPLEWLLLETDAPDQPDCRHRGGHDRERGTAVRAAALRRAMRGHAARTCPGGSIGLKQGPASTSPTALRATSTAARSPCPPPRTRMRR